MLNGTFKPITRLNENQFAYVLQISRAPIRKALKDYPLDVNVDINFLKNYYGNGITAIDKICGWAYSI